MTETELKNVAESAIQNADASATKCRATSIIENFNGGTLVVVGYEDEDEEDVESYVYFQSDRPTVFDDTAVLARFVAGREKPTFWSLALDTSKIGGITGIIALIITLTLCYKFAGTGEFSAPPLLANAWTMIIGVYFGSQVKK